MNQDGQKNWKDDEQKNGYDREKSIEDDNFECDDDQNQLKHHNEVIQSYAVILEIMS